MALFERGDVRINYEVVGEGPPVLLIAPGGMRSSIDFWANAPWNPVEVLPDAGFRVVAMDQRNAGDSTAPVSGSDGWYTYTDDQLALMDHLGIESFHVAGMCIGGAYIMALIDAAPERVRSAVLFQTIGLDDNRQAFYDMFDSWADALRSDHPEADDAAWSAFRERMYGGDAFVFTADEDFVSRVNTPMLVLMGDDLYHPQATSRRIAEQAPHATLIESWKEGDAVDAARAATIEFLQGA